MQVAGSIPLTVLLIRLDPAQRAHSHRLGMGGGAARAAEIPQWLNTTETLRTAMTEKERHAAALADPDNQPLSDAEWGCAAEPGSDHTERDRA